MKPLDTLLRELALCLNYNAETGDFYWKDSECNRHHIRGKKAGYAKNDGYVYINFKRKKILAHRAAWFIVFERPPSAQIDHINMNRGDNRLCNLREASHADNIRNRSAQANNTSGFKGVTFNKRSAKYEASIRFNKEKRSLGCFDTALEASQAYQAAAKEHHGEFARFN